MPNHQMAESSKKEIIVLAAIDMPMPVMKMGGLQKEGGFLIACPVCREIIVNNSQEILWPFVSLGGTGIRCDECNTFYKIPRDPARAAIQYQKSLISKLE